MTEAVSMASLGAAFAAGLLSVLSPCVLPLMPAYLSMVSGVSVEELREGGTRAGLRRRVLLASGGFVAGFSTVFVLLGASASAIGRSLQGLRYGLFGLEISLAQVAGVVLVVMGLHLLGVLRIPLLYREARYHGGGAPKSILGTFAIGAAFGFGWSPCIGPILGGILTVAAGRDTVHEGMLLLAVYAAGLGLPFFLAGWSIELFFRTFRRMKHHFRLVEIASGVALVSTGLLVAFNGLAFLNGHVAFLFDLVAAAEEALF